MDLALNNLQWLMCHKTKPNQFAQSLFQVPDNYSFIPKKYRAKLISFLYPVSYS